MDLNGSESIRNQISRQRPMVIILWKWCAFFFGWKVSVSDVKLFFGRGIGFADYEPVPGIGLFAHEFGDGAFGIGAVIFWQGHTQESAAGGIESGFKQEFSRHFTQAFESSDIRLGVVGQLPQNIEFRLIVGGPECLLPPGDFIKRWASEINRSIFDQLP